MPHAPRPSRPRTDRLRPILAAAVAAVAASVAACSSPLQPDYANRGAGTYGDSLIARALLDTTQANQLIRTPTVSGGVVEQRARVDSPGPAGVIPATAPDAQIGRETQARGLAAATLRQAEPVFNLTLQDAIARAARNNLAIKVEGYNPAIRESQIIEAEAVFDAVAFAQSNWQNLDDPSLTGGSSLANGTSLTNQIGVRRVLPSGTQVQASTSVTYRDLPTGVVLAPGLHHSNYSANINLQVTQPLLRGFGAGINEASIYLAQRDQRISLATFRRQVITSLANTEEAYYTLVLAKTNVDILVRLVKASEQTYQLVLSRADLDVTKASLNQALSALESRRADLLVAQRDYRNASDRLKSLLNDPELNISDNTLINPVDKPIVEPILYSTADCIEIALRQRTELQEARLQVEKTDIVVNVARNNLLPKVDLVAGLQTTGLDNGFDAAFGSTFDPTNGLDFNAGIRIEWTIGNRQFEAELARRLNERKQAVTQMVAIAQQVVLDVKTQLRTLLSTWEEIQIRDRTRIAAGNAFEGIVQLEDIRQRTPEFLQLKLDTQARLAQSEQELTQAVINYNLAIMRLEQAKGTLLEFNRVSLDRPPVDRSATDPGKRRFLGTTYLTR
jgi:outer membrane protein TolC